MDAEQVFRLSPPKTGPLRFACPRCKATMLWPCRRRGGGNLIHVHKERDALWRDYQFKAAKRLAWLEDEALPWLLHVTEEYLIGGKRPKRRKTDIAIAGRRAEEVRAILDDAGASR